jgi:hypothetical protein
MHQSTTPQTAQLAKLSHMSQLPATTFLHTSGGSLLIRRRSRDQQAHAAIAPATGGSVGYPIVRTRSCPADAEHGPFESENESERDHENENESENESGNESASSTSSSSSSSTTAAKSSDAVRTRPGAHKLKFQDQQYKNKRKGTTIAHHHLVHVLVPALAVDDVKPPTDAQSSHSGPIRTRSSVRRPRPPACACVACVVRVCAACLRDQLKKAEIPNIRELPLVGRV